MDIRKLVNQARPQQPETWHANQTLPPFSAIFPDPSYNAAAAYNYPIPPQGEGFNTYAAPYQTYPHQPQHQQQQLFAAPTTVPIPQYTRPPMSAEMPYLTSSPTTTAASSSNSSPRSTTKFAAPATSAERRSLSDEEDDSDSDESSGASSGGSTTPLPPYHFSTPTPVQQQQQQQVAFEPQPAAQPAQQQDTDFVCDDCGVSYSRAPDLRRHKASVHNDKDSREKVAATFPCEVCGQVLLSSHGYQGHMRRHYDERPFVCEAPFCGKAFHDSATLARHRRTHSTEHKFECDFCGRRFKRKDNLNTHRKKHQVGGESINPNLLRKPVTRVQGDSPPPAPAPAPQQQQVPTYGDLALSSYPAPAPAYSIEQEAPRQQFQQPPPPPQQYYQQPPPSYYQHPAPQPQYSPYQQRIVKAEEDFMGFAPAPGEYRSRAIRGVHIAPVSGR